MSYFDLGHGFWKFYSSQKKPDRVMKWHILRKVMARELQILRPNLILLLSDSTTKQAFLDNQQLGEGPVGLEQWRVSVGVCLGHVPWCRASAQVLRKHAHIPSCLAFWNWRLESPRSGRRDTGECRQIVLRRHRWCLVDASLGKCAQPSLGRRCRRCQQEKSW